MKKLKSIQEKLSVIATLMKPYTTIQQVKILNSCTNATELLEIKETLEELQLTSPVVQLVYDRMMQHFLETNKIAWLCQN